VVFRERERERERGSILLILQYHDTVAKRHCSLGTSNALGKGCLKVLVWVV
jgi:hypothetical protein